MTESDERISSFMKNAFNVEKLKKLDRSDVLHLLSIFLSEFLGTALFVFFTCSTVISSQVMHGINYPVLCLMIGATLASAILIFGHISGAHVNPAISLAAFIYGELSFWMFVMYSIAQFAGAIAAYLLIMIVHSKSVRFSPKSRHEAIRLCCSVPPSNNIVGIILLEAVATGVLCITMCSSWNRKNLSAQSNTTAVSMAIVAFVVCIPTALYTSCGLNPARSLAPALFTGFWREQWVYWIGPLSGSVIAAYLYVLALKTPYPLPLKPPNPVDANPI